MKRRLMLAVVVTKNKQAFNCQQKYFSPRRKDRKDLQFISSRFSLRPLRLCVILFVLGCILDANSNDADPFQDLDHPKPPTDDPFSDLDINKSKESPATTSANKINEDVKKSWMWRLFHENFTFKKEIYFQSSYSGEKNKSEGKFSDSVYSRQSVGFELLKKFSTKTATIASFNIQGRFVRRDNFVEVLNDGEGMERKGWFFEIHNAYLDFYNIFNPVFDDKIRSDNIGRFNFRIGRYYLPFGLNLQTDTHGAVLQLSNERNFGFERDWYAGLWGSVNADINYDLYYLLGAGYDISFKGQKGMIGARFSLANKYRNDYGIEASLSFMNGERISKHAVERSPSVAADADNNNIVDTLRLGLDWRYTRAVPSGSLAFATELSVGQDESDRVATQLHQLEYLNRSRKWGLNAQYRRFWQDIGHGRMPPSAVVPRSADASIFGEFTWYFRNDIGNSNLHWIKLNVERQIERQRGDKDTIVTLQYYRYW